MICLSESSIERVKVSHVIVECRVINHHPRILSPNTHLRARDVSKHWYTERAKNADLLNSRI